MALWMDYGWGVREEREWETGHRVERLSKLESRAHCPLSSYLAAAAAATTANGSAHSKQKTRFQDETARGGGGGSGASMRLEKDWLLAAGCCDGATNKSASG